MVRNKEEKPGSVKVCNEKINKQEPPFRHPSRTIRRIPSAHSQTKKTELTILRGTELHVLVNRVDICHIKIANHGISLVCEK